MEAARTASQHKQARERERLKGIKEDEEMQDETLPKQVPYIPEVGRSCSASLAQTQVNHKHSHCKCLY